MKQRTRERVRADLVRLSGAKLGLAPLIDEAGRLIEQAVPSDGGCWHTMDPATLIETSVRTVNLPPHEERITEYEYLHRDYNKFVELARSTRHSGVLSEATSGDLHRSARYRDFMHPAGIRGELRTSLVVDDTCWGSFAFFRAAPADFNTEERDFAHGLAATLGRSFRTALIHTASTATATPSGPGLILFDHDRHVESFTEPARHWLAELGFTGEPNHHSLPHALLAVTQRARAAATDAVARVPGISGHWIMLHASAASGTQPDRVAVILQGAAPASIAPLIAAAYGLTKRERQLTELILQGHITGDIATRLLLSPHTVQEHLKSIFTKTGVRSRRELVSTVFMRHYHPRLQPTRTEPTPSDGHQHLADAGLDVAREASSRSRRR